jgi:phenylpropionate dioxygenase-like ring-hydroxylating dioxygenase large terminal subunit
MFLSHKLNLSKNGYKPLAQCNNHLVLVDAATPYLQDNICPHQKSLISIEGGSGVRACPYHGLAFTPEGNMIETSKSLRLCPGNNKLKNTEVFEWNNLLFNVPITNEDLNFVDFNNFSLVEQRIDIVNSSSKNIMDLFLDVDHIPTVHSGVYDQIGIEISQDVTWKYYEYGSLQLVKNDIQADSFANTLLESDYNNPYGAAWLAIYPGTMIEWQPGALFITVAVDQSNGTSQVHVFKYKDTRYQIKNWHINEDVWECAWSQDKQQAQLLTEFNLDNLEKSKQHFRDWLNDKQME